jgi:hypothetical protein
MSPKTQHLKLVRKTSSSVESRGNPLENSNVTSTYVPPRKRALRAPKTDPWAYALGAMIGGLVPVLCYYYARHDLNLSKPLWTQPVMLSLAGGFLFVLSTGDYVYRHIPLSKRVSLVTGPLTLMYWSMVFADSLALRLVALGCLVVITGFLTGVQMGRQKSLW